jgi:hypothetical protein
LFDLARYLVEFSCYFFGVHNEYSLQLREGCCMC